MVKLVGILNVTPDSFSDGGLYIDAEVALRHVEKLFADGAALVDIGAESTRPGATPLSADEEWRRLAPILPECIRRYPKNISLDTYHVETVKRALTLGDVIINDVTGLQDQTMFDFITTKRVRCVSGSLPVTGVQAAHHGQLIDDINIVIDDLQSKHAKLVEAGVPPEYIILDPCIGFGKTSALNWKLLEIATYLPDKHVMIGYSRKRFLGTDRMELTANLQAAAIASKSGAEYLRVHDVAGHVRFLNSHAS